MIYRIYNTAVLLVVLGVARSALALPQEDIRVTNGITSQQYLGGGRKVIVGVLDCGIDSTHPAIRGAQYLERDFTGQGVADDTNKKDVGHGTGVAGIIFGRDGTNYLGLAPRARLINARVSLPDETTSDLWTGAGMIWTARNGAKVINMSFGNRTDITPLTDKINLLSDYLSLRYGVTMVSAAGNENDSAVQQIPGGAYNGITVGALGAPDYSRVSWFSNYALPNQDLRTKPDLVAPGEQITVAASNWEKRADYIQADGTSYAAPMVSGVLAQMYGYGKANKLPTDPLLMKAILMTSATKVKRNDGSPWDPRHGKRDSDYGYRYNQPLDEEQGAGMIDAVAAYRIYAKAKARSTPLSTWAEGKLQANQSYTLHLGQFNTGQRVDATLAWYRRVDYKDLNNNGLDADDTFYQTAKLADFALTLVRDGVPIGASDSDVDNTEHLSWTLEADGDYSLEVYRFAGSGVLLEDFALAARVLKGTAPSLAAMALTSTRQSVDDVSFSKSMVPEPGASMALALLGLVLLQRRR